MLSKTHRYGGAVASMILIDTYLYQYTNFPEQLIFLAGAVIGSLVPDIDMQGSKIQQVAPNVGNSIRGSVSSLAMVLVTKNSGRAWMAIGEYVIRFVLVLLY